MFLSPQTHCRGLAASTSLFSRHQRKWFGAFFCFLSFGGAAAVPAQAHTREQNRPGGGAGMMGSTSPKVFETGKSKRCTGDMVLRRLSITNAPQQGELQKDKPGPWIFRHSNMSKKHLNPNLTWVHAHIHAPSPRLRNTPSYVCRLIPPISTSQLTDSAMSPPFTGRVARQISTICTASS